MASQNTPGGTTVSFSNTPQAVDDTFNFTVASASGILILDVMANDLGGNAKSLWSVDNTISANALSPSGKKEVYAPVDLLIKDTVFSTDVLGDSLSTDTSKLGAKIWIDARGKIGYDASSIQSLIAALQPGQTLTDTFTYAIKLVDGTLSWATATVNITNSATDRPPETNLVSVSGNEDNTIAITLSGSDADGTVASFHIIDLPTNGILSLSANGGGVISAGGSVTVASGNSVTIYFTPASNWSGSTSFHYAAVDNQGVADSTPATATVSVNGVADAPHLTTTAASGAADAAIALTINVALSDSSETLGQVEIQGVPSAYVLNHGTLINDGDWLVSVSDLPMLALTLIEGAATPGSFALHVTATSIDGSSKASTAADLNVSVTPIASQLTGHVIEGYVAGATVFADTNGNGLLDLGEAHTTTNADGSFTLTGGSGPLVMFGGTDVSTGLAFQGMLKAPEGSTVVTPLTTLVAALAASNGGDLAAAQDSVAAAFGFDPSINLQTYDPVPAAVAGDPAALAVLSAAIQVQSTITQIAAVTHTTGTVVHAIAEAITGASGGAVDLSQTTTIESIATQAGVNSDATGTVAEVVTAAIDSVHSATDVTALAQAGKVAQGAATGALAAITDFTDQSQTGPLVGTYVTDLATQVANAQVGDVNGATIGTLGDDVLTGGSGVDAIDGLDGNDKINGLGGDDLLYGGLGKDVLTGGAGNDFLDGGLGRDLAVYTDATGGITVDLAAGTVSGAGVGTDTLRSIEQIRGSNFDDHISAAGFGAESPNAPSPDKGIANNFIEGMAGDDIITGNGFTSISYESAGTPGSTTGVTVDLAAGLASGDASVGTDHFTGVIGVGGSAFDDHLYGSNTTLTGESFLPRAGNDYIDGRGGFDGVFYSSIIGGDAVTGGISVDLAAGIVTGDASVGTDTLRSIESVRGTNFVDHFDATGFGSSSTNAGSNGTSNTFEGAGGNDVIVGNGNTQISFFIATAAVTVDLAAHTATGDASVGSDTYSGVIGAIGSFYDDTLRGDNNNNLFTGFAGNDLLDGRGGNDTAIYQNDPSAVNVNLALGTAHDGYGTTDTLISIENVTGSSFGDTLIGDNNGNSLIGGPGNDTINGGGGNDTANYFNSPTAVAVDLTLGTASDGFGTTDTLISIENVFGSSFDDTFIGDNNNNFFTAGAGNDTINGGNGTDTASYSTSTAAVSVDLSAGTAADGFGTTDTLTSIENVFGSNFDDTFIGDNNNNFFTGGAGNDTLNGGNGNDSASYSTSPIGVTIDLTLGTAPDGFGTTDTFISIENITGSAFDDTLIGNSNSNSFTGGAGNDTLNGGNGSDSASYSNSTAGVTVDLGNGTAADGFGTTDTLVSIENVFGSNFADRITGDANNNRLTGGAGADTFVFAPGFGIDTIPDLTAGSGAGHDIIELHNSGFADFASLQNAGAITGTTSTVITLGADRITLTGVNPALLTADDFLFFP